MWQAPKATAGVSVGMDERDKKRMEYLEKLRAGQVTADPTRILNGDRAFRYKGVYQHERSVNRHKAQGFETLPPGDEARFQCGTSEDGKKMGDLIIMREPLELYEAKQIFNREKREGHDEHTFNTMIDEMNRTARNAHAVGAHKSSVFDLREEEIK